MRKESVIKISFWISILVLMFVSWLAYKNYTAVSSSRQWVTHTFVVINKASDCRAVFRTALNNLRIYYITGLPFYKKLYHDNIDSTISGINTLRLLTSDNAQRTKELTALSSWVAEQKAIFDQNVNFYEKAGLNNRLMTKIVLKEDSIKDVVINGFNTLREKELFLLDIRRQKLGDSSTQTINIFSVGLSLSLIFLVIIFLMLTKEIKERRAGNREILELNNKLKTKVDELNYINSELESFSYSVSHDLRTPLRHISGFLELLKKNIVSTLSDNDKRYMNIITDSAAKMGDLIEGLLVLSRTGRQEISKSEVDMNILINEILNEVKYQQNTRFVVADIPAVMGDFPLLKSAFSNLISNAVKYSSQKEQPEVIINYTNGGNELIISIKDNGAGFDMKYYDKLFGIFQRLHSDSEFDGIGIGLATAQKIIHKHNGKIWAESAPGEGAIFFVSLPLN